MLSLTGAAKQTQTMGALRASHERILVLCALGNTFVEIAEITGYSPSRVATICNAPAAQERIAQMVTEVRAELIKRELDADYAMKDLERRTAMLAANMEYDQLAEAEAKGTFIPLRDLQRRVADYNDRYGVPKKSTNVNINTDFGSKLEEAIARSDAVRASGGTTITDPRSLN
jgi:hypothetical protein